MCFAASPSVLVQKNAGCKGGGGITISETYSINECAYECGKKQKTLFRYGNAGSAYCSGKDRCHCKCIMNANTDTCQIVTSNGLALYKNSQTGNIIQIFFMLIHHKSHDIYT